MSACLFTLDPLKICHSTDEQLDNIIKNCTLPSPNIASVFECDRASGFSDNLLWANAEKLCRKLYPNKCGAALTRFIQLEGQANTPAMRIAFATVLAGKKVRLTLNHRYQLEICKR
jgi:hypothetical protein